MAYTYDEFMKSATNAGVLDRFSQEDLAVAQKSPEYGLSMVSLLKNINGATTAEQRLLATEAANQLRKNYGVYGTNGTYAGSFGSQMDNLQSQLQNYGSFQYAGQDQLQKAQDKVNNFGDFAYGGQDQMDALRNQLQNYGSFTYGNEGVYQQILNDIVQQRPFSYDPGTDPSMSAYRKAYLREGERAGANALAQAAAANGGQTSSYALQAAQQANNYYAGQLADVIPTLEQNAYQRYLNDFQSKLSGLGALQSDRAQAQQQWQDGYNLLQNNLADLQNDRNFDYQNYLTRYEQAMNALANMQNDRAQAQEDWLNGYNILQNNLSNLQQQDATDYQRYLQQVEQALNQQQYADQQEQLKFENALALYNLLGYATPEVAEILGLNSGKVTTSNPNKGRPSGSPTNDGPGDGTEEEMLEEQPAVEEEMDYTVTNGHSDAWVKVQGGSRVTWTELAQMVEKGTVKEVIDREKGTITYKAVGKGTQSTSSKSPGTAGITVNNRVNMMN